MPSSPDRRPGVWAANRLGRLAPLAATLACASVAACPLTADDGNTLAGAAVTAAWRLPEGPIRVSTPFSLIVRACPPDTELLAVDATMPVHRHGMNYAPSINVTGPGQWRVDGLLWHMAGQWELRFELRAGGRTGGIERLHQAVALP